MKFWARSAATLLLVLTLWGGAVTGPVRAEDEILTLENALETALLNNPEVQAARAKLGVSDARILTAAARINPTLLSDNGVAEETYRLGIEKTFELGGKRRRRIELAEGERDVVLAGIQTTILNLRAEVRKAYTRLYSLQQRQQSYQALLSTSERLLEISQQRELAGDIAQVDVLQARMEMLNARNEFESIRHQVTQARNALNLLLNQPMGSTVTLSAPNTFPEGVTGQIAMNSGQPLTASGSVSLLDIDPDKLAELALNFRPEMQENVGELEVAERQLALAKAARVPNLSLTAGPDLVTEGGNELNVFVIGTVQLPVLNRQQGPIQEALARQNELTRQQVALKNRIALEVNNAYTDFVLNRERIHRYETEILPTAAELVEKSQRSFEVGKSSIFIPLNAQRACQTTQLGYQQALLDYQNAISDLERAIGSGL